MRGLLCGLGLKKVFGVRALALILLKKRAQLRRVEYNPPWKENGVV